MSKEFNKYLELIQDVRASFFDYHTQSQTLSNYEYMFQYKTCVAYRAIILNAGPDRDSRYASQVDMDKVTEKYRSWSTSMDGITSFLNQEIETEDRYVVIFKGTIEALDLKWLCKSIENEIHPDDFSEEDYEELSYELKDLNLTLSQFQQENEMLAYSVKDFLEIKSGLYSEIKNALPKD